ncbi:MAG: NADH-quinone oxidoreductase subunit L [Gemmatimonas sp.]|nr:NADH-quinone oxidoreductase subunit L [Gemmatimonas sp.]
MLRSSLTGDPVPDQSFAPLAWLLPGAFVVGALLVRGRPQSAWTIGARITLAAPVLALLASPALAPVARVMAFLIAGLGAVTLRFSTRYLDGEADGPRYVQWFLLALAGAALVTVSRDLVITGLAWTLTSLALHQLLTVGPARAAAEIAAHKKFLLSRVADLAVASAIICIAVAYGTTDIARVLAAASAGDVPTTATAGTLLLAGAIILRSAQLPFHGWLIQVMEAPTPVSALLHAGIINLGAYVAISLAPLFVAVPTALTLLALTGLVSATLAALVMRTRGSVKGALAWSTCAQMGFVLVEIGFGAFDLALLHIVAHGAYKANAFLASGSGVQTAAQQTHARLPLRATTPLSLAAQVPSLGRWITATVLVVVPVAASLASGTWQPENPSTLLSTAVVMLAIIPAIAQLPVRSGTATLRGGLGIVLGLPALYAIWHVVLAPIAPPAGALPLPTWIAALVIAGFTTALATQAIVARAPQGRLARGLYPHALAGFHLDAVFTRLTFRIWPPTITAPAVRQRRERSPLRIERAA